MWGSVCNSTWPNPVIYLLEEGGGRLEVVCVSISDCLLLVSMRLPSVLSSSRIAISACCKGEQPGLLSSALLLFPFLLIAVIAPCVGAVLCKPLSVLVTHSGDEFLPTSASSHQSLCAASTPSLESAFSWKLTCLAKVAHCCCLDYFQE